MGHGHGGSADHRGGRDEARPSGGGGEGGKKGRVVIKLRGLRPRAAVADGAATANGCGTTTTGGRGGVGEEERGRHQSGRGAASARGGGEALGGC